MRRKFKFLHSRNCTVAVESELKSEVWHEVFELLVLAARYPCGYLRYNLVACRYKGGDEANCRTPNMKGQFASNVFKAARTRQKCTEMVPDGFRRSFGLVQLGF